MLLCDVSRKYFVTKVFSYTVFDCDMVIQWEFIKLITSRTPRTVSIWSSRSWTVALTCLRLLMALSLDRVNEIITSVRKGLIKQSTQPTGRSGSRRWTCRRESRRSERQRRESVCPVGTWRWRPLNELRDTHPPVRGQMPRMPLHSSGFSPPHPYPTGTTVWK